jgi:Acetyltransferase (GNAT) domain
MMTIYDIDPTRDERWDEFLQKCANASVFHTRGWLEALRQTYQYKPVAFTTTPPGSPLTNGFPFCEIYSWLSGPRLVSLPFSDHCTPLLESTDELTCILAYLRERLSAEEWSYIEIRPRDSVVTVNAPFVKSKSFFLHTLDLRPSLDEIFQSFHKDCVQRKIERATREKIRHEEGRSESLLANFYHLLLMTRRRHGLPAQPIKWFRNILGYVGNNATIRVAYKDRHPIASIFTLRHKHVLVYKYGCSDRTFSNLGGTQLLFWNAIQEAKRDQIAEFDMGRSDCDNPGLISFKDRWNAARTESVYLRYPVKYSNSVADTGQSRISKYVWSHVPSGVLAAAGRVLYKHMG